MHKTFQFKAVHHRESRLFAFEARPEFDVIVASTPDKLASNEISGSELRRRRAAPSRHRGQENSPRAVHHGGPSLTRLSTSLTLSRSFCFSSFGTWTVDTAVGNISSQRHESISLLNRRQHHPTCLRCFEFEISNSRAKIQPSYPT